MEEKLSLFMLTFIHLSSSVLPYIVGVDVPRHVAIGDQLTVDIATNLRVPPAVVDVDDADHVPLKHRHTLVTPPGDQPAGN